MGNKNTLTRLANCNDTSRHQPEINQTPPIIMWKIKKKVQSRKNGQKLQFGQHFDDFEVKYLKIAIFSQKQVSFKLKVLFNTNFRQKTKKIVRAVFEKSV